MSERTCALPGCEKPVTIHHHHPHYCSTAHLHYHRRDKQFAAWLRSDDAGDRRAAHNPHEHPGPEYWADAIDAGEHQ